MNEKFGTPPLPKERKGNDYFLRTLAELFFTLLPFVILFIVFAYKNNLSDMIYISEWSFAAVILNGQALVKFAVRIMEFSGRMRRTPNLDKITILISGFIVLIFVPSLVILAIAIFDNSKSQVFAIVQILLFILSSAAYVFLGHLLSGRSNLLPQIEF